MLTSALRIGSVLLIAYCCVAIDGARSVRAEVGGCDPEVGTCQGSCNSLYLWRNNACSTPNQDPGEACLTGNEHCNNCGCKKDGDTNNCTCR